MMPSLKSIIALTLIILGIHIIAMANYLYWTIWWFDIPMHFMGGILLAMIFFRFVKPELIITHSSFLITILLAVSFAAFLGILWEFFEFIWASYFTNGGLESLSVFQSRGIDIYRDTLKDLFFDLLGGFGFAVFAAKGKD
ncbi:MAG: hypothetical protein NTW60_02015 [Candidatus Wolfebacteria bacterium]|nr:hypothetical protein [Candidatus Wolfebacteria bacterium]